MLRAKAEEKMTTTQAFLPHHLSGLCRGRERMGESIKKGKEIQFPSF